MTILFFLFWLGFIALGYFVFIPNLAFLPLWIVLGPVVALLMLVLILIILMPLMKYTKPNLKFKYYLAKSAAKFINRFAIRAKVTAEGVENIPKSGPLTVYGNHKSQIDPVVVMSIFKRTIAFTPKISLYKIPIMSNYMNYIGCLPIDRENNRQTAKTMIKAIKNVKDGHALLIFPEAGIVDRTDEKISDIKGGAFQIGKKSESNLLPITIMGASEYSRRTNIFKKVHIHIIVHPVILNEEIKDLNTHEIAEKVKNIINEPFLKSN